MRRYQNFQGLRFVRLAAIGAGLAVLAACAQPGAGGGTGTAAAPAKPAVPAAAYRTQSQHFSAMQRAALAADYKSFARHLNPADEAAIVQKLTENFRGKPFDVYTRKTRTSAADHRRGMELRGQNGRLYLLVTLAKAGKGWNIGSYTLERQRAILTRL